MPVKDNLRRFIPNQGYQAYDPLELVRFIRPPVEGNL